MLNTLLKLHSIQPLKEIRYSIIMISVMLYTRGNSGSVSATSTTFRYYNVLYTARMNAMNQHKFSVHCTGLLNVPDSLSCYFIFSNVCISILHITSLLCITN
jgi:hypothetical protein